MKRVLVFLSVLVFFSCKSRNAPDIDSIKVDVEVKRFDLDFFALDTGNISGGIAALQRKYKEFTDDFVVEILGLQIDSLQSDSSSHARAVRTFLEDYQPVKDLVEKKYKNFNSEAEEIIKGLRYVKYYFPEYQIPHSIITFIGPFDANFLTSFGIQGDILTRDGLGVALQFHLGKNSKIYDSPALQALYPEFITENFDEDHIAINCMHNIVDDLYPDNTRGRALIEQMVEKGKRYYLLSRFLPSAKEYQLMGYTKDQYKSSIKNEGVIWSFFLSNELLNTSEQDVIKNYIGQSPKTAEFGDDAPGNLGSFSGLQIVKKYMGKYPETTVQDLMIMNPRRIYMLSKYKPAL